MKSLDRYLLATLIGTTTYLSLGMTLLYALFDLMAQSGDLGRGQFHFGQLLLYIALHLPAYFYQVAPISTLIGAMLALNRLVDHNEYAVILTSGFSIKRLIGILMLFATFCAAAMAISSEWLIPSANALAQKQRHTAIYGQAATLSKNRLWLKNGDEMIEIEALLPDGSLKNISRYRIKDQKLLRISHADNATWQGERQWQQQHIQELLFHDQHLTTTQHTTQLWQQGIDPEWLAVLIVKSEDLSVRQLINYIDYLQRNHQETQPWQVALWNKVFYPFSSFAMALAALLFTPIIRRHANLGQRIFLGIALGLAFHFSGRFFSFYANLFGLSAFLAGALPVLIFFSIFAILTYYRLLKTQ